MKILIGIFVILLAAAGCGRHTTYPNFQLECTTPQCAVLQWNPVTQDASGNPITNLAGYKVYYGTAPGTYVAPITIGMAPAYTVQNLEPGVIYYFAVTAINTAGLESGFSNEVSKQMP